MPARFIQTVVRTRRAKVIALLVSLIPIANAQFVGSETFAGTLRQDKWFPFTEGVGNISIWNQKFNFTTSSSRGNHEAGLAWIQTPVRYFEDWEFHLDVQNTLTVSHSSRYAAVGIYVANENDERDLAYLEFYATYFDNLRQSVRGFTAGLTTNGIQVHESDTFELPTDIGAVRAKFDSRERALTFYFHTGSTEDGYFWQYLAKYGLDGNDGKEANTNWLMPFNAEFDVGLYGTVVDSRSGLGQLTADNFSAGRTTLGLHEEDFEFTVSRNEKQDAVDLRWFSFDGLEYVVQESTDLIGWSDIATISGTGGYSDLEVPLATPVVATYYRVYSRIP